MTDAERKAPLPLPASPPGAAESQDSGVHDLSRSADGWWRTQSATLALLKHTHAMLEATEKRLAEQEQRIEQLEDMASTDPLTGLMNRRGFEKFYAREMERIRRYHSPGALLVLIDLDRFKQLNDLYGHLAGDACLQGFGQRLLQSIRMLDGAARLGGDELALLLTQIPPDRTEQRIQKIRRLLNDVTLEWEGKTLHCGASLGAAVVTADSAFKDVYSAADAALYADKKERRRQKPAT